MQAVFEYTRDTIAAFRAAGVLPDMVQIGNEVINGMLWPDGKLPEHWDNFAELLKAGIRGVEAGRGDGPRPRIMIHIDRGADRRGTKAVLRPAEFVRRGLRRDRPVVLPLVARQPARPAREPRLHGRRVPEGHHPGGGGLLLAAQRISQATRPVPGDAPKASGRSSTR